MNIKRQAGVSSVRIDIIIIAVVAVLVLLAELYNQAGKMKNTSSQETTSQSTAPKPVTSRDDEQEVRATSLNDKRQVIQYRK